MPAMQDISIWREIFTKMSVNMNQSELLLIFLLDRLNKQGLKDSDSSKDQLCPIILVENGYFKIIASRNKYSI